METLPISTVGIHSSKNGRASRLKNRFYFLYWLNYGFLNLQLFKADDTIFSTFHIIPYFPISPFAMVLPEGDQRAPFLHLAHVPFSLMMYSRESTSQKVSQAGSWKNSWWVGIKDKEKQRRRKRYTTEVEVERREWTMGLVEDTTCGPEGLAACAWWRQWDLEGPARITSQRPEPQSNVSTMNGRKNEAEETEDKV